MTLDIIIVIAIVIGAAVLFATEKLPVDMTAILVMAVLLLTGIITPEEGISGFSNTATVTVAAMFILSAALNKTGAVLFVGEMASKMFKYNFWLGVVLMMISVGVLSAFINNTPVVAVFIPVVLRIAAANQFSASKILMPLSFASMFGGVCTLIGTSTNILVSSIAVQYNQPAFSMFEFTSLGMLFFGAGLIYMILIGIRMIKPNDIPADLTQKYSMSNYLTDIVLLPEAKSVGQRLIESALVKELEIDILDVVRDGKRLLRPTSEIVFEAGDMLRVRCDVKKIQELKDRVGVKLKSNLKLQDEDFQAEDLLLVESIIAPNSRLIGKTIKSSRFRNLYRANALALRHSGQLYHTEFINIPLKPGDALLLEVRKENLEDLKRDPDFVLVSGVDLPKYRKSKIIPALIIVAGVIVTATLNITPIMISAIVGSILLVLTKCISLEETYRAIEWNIVFLLGGILSLGIALEKTGAALLLANNIVSIIGFLGPVAIVAAFYLITSLLTEIMSNNASAVLLAPIAIAVAESMGISARPLLMAVTFAASASFMTPVGYQTNTMIFGVGQYKFSDFIKIGGPLNLIFWILATIFIPILFPF
ncbi:MAG: sodium-coupled transporter [Ignavibacterium sp.]|nr:sodium-coupled transporter [Ignavibacterium sp.]